MSLDFETDKASVRGESRRAVDRASGLGSEEESTSDRRLPPNWVVAAPKMSDSPPSGRHLQTQVTLPVNQLQPMVLTLLTATAIHVRRRTTAARLSPTI